MDEPVPFELEIPAIVADLPFRDDAGLVLLDGEAGGLPCAVEFDSLTFPHAIADAFARRLALPAGPGAASDGVAAREVPTCLLPRLRIGPLVARHLACHRETLGGPAAPDLMLGAPLLERAVVTVDFARCRLRVVDPAGWTPPPEDDATARFEFAAGPSGVPEVRGADLLLDGAVPATRLLVDTGNNSSLLVAGDLARDLGLREGAPGVSAVRAGGYGGETLLLRRRLRSLRLGPVEVEDVDVHAFPGAVGRFFSEPGWVNVGTGILRHFSVTFALPRGLLLLSAAV